MVPVRDLENQYREECWAYSLCQLFPSLLSCPLSPRYRRASWPGLIGYRQLMLVAIYSM